MRDPQKELPHWKAGFPLPGPYQSYGVLIMYYALRQNADSGIIVSVPERVGKLSVRFKTKALSNEFAFKLGHFFAEQTQRSGVNFIAIHRECQISHEQLDGWHCLVWDKIKCGTKVRQDA